MSDSVVLLLFLLWVQVGLMGMFQYLSGTFMSGQVIFFPMLLSARTMGLGGTVLVFCRYLL